MLIKNIIKPVNGIDIHCKLLLPDEENDNATWIVMLHEGLGSIPQWKQFPDKIFNAFHNPVLLYERIGYGDTGSVKDVLPDNYFKVEAVEVLPLLLQAFHIRSFYLLGHSDGATISLLYASSKPIGLKAIIAIAPHVFIEEVTVSGVKQLSNDYQKGILGFFLTKYHHEKTDILIQRWLQTWLHEPMLSWNMFDELKKIEVPVLTIQGTQDEYGSIKQLQLIAQHCPSPTQHIIIENGHHTPHLEYESIVLYEMSRFIST